MAIETVNLAGFSHAGAPVMIRGSSASPRIAIASAGSISRPVAVSGAFVCQSRFNMPCVSVLDVNTVNMTISSGVDTVNTRALFCLYMVRSPRPRPQKKPSNRYHHGDLRRALLDEAIRTIQSHGVE